MPLMDDMFTMEPPPTFCISGITLFMPRNTPLALMSIRLSQPSTLIESE